MRRLKGATLLEAIVAALLFLLVFTAAMELLPRLTIREDDTLLLTEADYRVRKTFEKYAAACPPCGDYAEAYDWGRIEIRITHYGDFPKLRVVVVKAQIDGSRKTLEHRQLIEWDD